LNSVMQCLLGESAFVEEVTRLANLCQGDDKPVTRAIYGVIRERIAGASIICLGRLKGALARSKFGAIFAGYEQQDAHEAFIKILECIEFENPKAYRCPFSHTVSVEVTCAACGHVAHVEETGHLNIMVDVRAEKKETIGMALRKMSERVKKDCEGCGGTSVEHSRTSEVVALPKVLVVQLRRFEFRSGIMAKVGDLYSPQKKVVVPSDGSKTYQLSGVVSHHGLGVGRGHYMAAVRQASTWNTINDGIVHPSSEADVHRPSSASYLLFYNFV
jgi:ubiquitin C-terminal hydrolase